MLLAGVRDDLAKIPHRLRFADWLPAERIYPEEDRQYSATLRAARHACQAFNQRNPVDSPLGQPDNEAAYYLVT